MKRTLTFGKVVRKLGEKLSLLRKGSKIFLVVCAWLFVITILLVFGM